MRDTRMTARGALCVAALVLGSALAAWACTLASARGVAGVPRVSAPPTAALLSPPVLPDRPAVCARAFVQSAVAPAVQAMEIALATANQHVRRYAGPAGLLTLSVQPATPSPQEGSDDAAAALVQQAFAVRAAGATLASLPIPAAGSWLTLQLGRLLEDLELVGDQLATVMQDTAQALEPPSMGAAKNHAAAQDPAYGLRVRNAVQVLRRAEGWLETIDSETGAAVRLPGFAPGAPPIEAQLDLQ
jgi:hypothetical protein